MSKLPDTTIKLSDTLILCEYESGGSKGYWLWDDTRGGNLAMRAKSERQAFVETLHYYQERLKDIEQRYSDLKDKVDTFVSQFDEDDE